MKKSLVFLLFFVAFFKAFSQLPPTKPVISTATQVGLSNQISLNWTASTGSPIGYKIYYRRLGGGPRDSVRVGFTTAHTLTNLTYNNDYSIRIRAFRRNSALTDTIYSALSDSVKVRLVSLVAPVATTAGPAPVATPTRVGITIVDSNPFETGFEIELTPPSGPVITRSIVGAITSDTKLIDGLIPNTKYSFRVRAMFGTIPGPYSVVQDAKTEIDIPPAAQVTAVRSCPTYAEITWTIPNRPDEINYFVIQRSVDNVNFVDAEKTFPAGERSYFDSGVIPGKTIFYKIISVNNSGTAESNRPSIAISDYVSPNPPKNIISDLSKKTDKSITIRWTNGDEDQLCKTNIRAGYVLEIKDAQGNYTELSPRPDYFATSYEIKGLSPNQIVDLRLTAISDKGILSERVAFRDVAFGPPNPPKNLIGVRVVDSFERTFLGLSWQTADADYTYVERSEGGPNNFGRLALVKASEMELKDFLMQEGVVYYYRVHSGNYFYGLGEYSNVIGPFILDYTKAPNAPYLLKATLQGTKVNLLWKDDANNEENFIIEKSSDNGATYSLVATLNRNILNYTDENTLAGKNYLYRVKTQNPKGSSAFSRPVLISIPGTAAIQDQFVVYPNPFESSLSIIKIDDSLESKNITFEIYNANNKLVKSGKITEGSDIDLKKENLPIGNYFVRIDNNGTITYKRVLKQ